MEETKSEIETLEIMGSNTNNPHNPPEEKKNQINQLLHWVFTWNNYQKEDIETLETLFRHLSHKYCFQEETGETGTPHLQGVVSLKKKMRWTEFGLPREIHWEKCKSLTKAYLYCCKEKSRTGKIYNFNYKVRRPLKLLEESKFFEWQRRIIEIVKQEPDDRKVYWFWSTKGNIGKSTFAKYCVAKLNALFFEEGKKADIMKLIFDADMDDKNLVIIDVPRANGNKVSYKSIESIKNGMIYSSKYEGGYKLFNPPHLFVFANEPPQRELLSEDRWMISNID